MRELSRVILLVSIGASPLIYGTESKSRCFAYFGEKIRTVIGKIRPGHPVERKVISPEDQAELEKLAMGRVEEIKRTGHERLAAVREIMGTDEHERVINGLSELANQFVTERNASGPTPVGKIHSESNNSPLHPYEHEGRAERVKKLRAFVQDAIQSKKLLEVGYFHDWGYTDGGHSDPHVVGTITEVSEVGDGNFVFTVVGKIADGFGGVVEVKKTISTEPEKLSGVKGKLYVRETDPGAPLPHLPLM